MFEKITLTLLLPVCALIFVACAPQPDISGSMPQSEEQPVVSAPLPAPEPEAVRPGRPAAQEFTILLEGLEEKVEWTLYRGAGYSFYYDAEGLSELTETAEGFKAAVPQTPPVWLAISVFKDAAPQIAGMSESMVGKYQAWFAHSPAGNKFDSEVRDKYILETTEGGYMLIELGYFLEASEGWGARMRQMIETLEFE